MENELLEFLYDIHEDFCWLLYRKEYTTTHIYEGERFDETFRADFPYCCDLASVLLASYLSVHVSDTAKVYITQNLPFNHSWCECEGEIIDYTYFQFDIEPEMKKRFKNYELEKEEFSNYILQKDIIWTGNSGHINTQAQFISVKELELISKEIAKKYSFGKDDFLIYANEAYEMVELKLNNIEKISVS